MGHWKNQCFCGDIRYGYSYFISLLKSRRESSFISLCLKYPVVFQRIFKWFFKNLPFYWFDDKVSENCYDLLTSLVKTITECECEKSSLRGIKRPVYGYQMSEQAMVWVWWAWKLWEVLNVKQVKIQRLGSFEEWAHRAGNGMTESSNRGCFLTQNHIPKSLVFSCSSYR